MDTFRAIGEEAVAQVQPADQPLDRDLIREQAVAVINFLGGFLFRLANGIAEIETADELEAFLYAVIAGVAAEHPRLRAAGRPAKRSPPGLTKTRPWTPAARTRSKASPILSRLKVGPIMGVGSIAPSAKAAMVCSEFIRPVGDGESDGQLLEQCGDGFDRHGLVARSGDDDAPEGAKRSLTGLQQFGAPDALDRRIVGARFDVGGGRRYIGGAHCHGRISPPRIRIHDRDALCSRHARPRRGREADAPGSDHQNGFALSKLGRVHTVQPNGKRFHQRCVGGGEAIGQHEGVPRGHSGELGEPAPIGPHAEVPGLSAVRDGARGAGRACSA